MIWPHPRAMAAKRIFTDRASAMVLFMIILKKAVSLTLRAVPPRFNLSTLRSPPPINTLIRAPVFITHARHPGLLYSFVSLYRPFL